MSEGKEGERHSKVELLNNFSCSNNQRKLVSKVQSRSSIAEESWKGGN